LRLSDFIHGSQARREAFAERLVTQLTERGFFYLERPAALLARNGVDERFEHYEAIYQQALLEHPHLSALMNAPTVFQTGYNSTWFPESTSVRQAIEAFMAKPALWKDYRKRPVPVAVRELLEASEQVYRACHVVALVLLEALELGYGLRPGGLLRLFRKHTEGAVRFVKYHAPCPTRARRVLTTHASEPHADKSFFTFNLGESRPGLLWLDGKTPRLLPNGEGHWLVTSGRYSEGLTQRLERPVRSFQHTVINDGERIVILGFVTPEGELHDIPVEEWPHPPLLSSHAASRSWPASRRGVPA
jgi:isopenicillin N synthase-like dioxygenase